MRGVGYVPYREENCTKFWSEYLKGRDHLEDKTYMEVIFTGLLKKQCMMAWNQFMWLCIESSDGIL
jgi:hypothetical protein